MYAQKNLNKVKALAPISSVVSGQMTIDIIPNEDLEKWKKDGFKIKESQSKPGVIKKLKFSHFADRAKYNILPEANKLTMPVLLIVGEDDDTTPPSHQELLFNELPGEKELHIIKGVGHIPRKERELKEIYNLFDKWIKKNTK